MTLMKVRLASVGLGKWGNVLAAAVARSGAGEIIQCFDPDRDALSAFTETARCRPAFDLDELLRDEEVEAVLIATPHSTHADIVCQAASAGKHIYIEKPFTLSVADARRSIEAAAKAGLVLQVGHQRRFQRATRRIREMIDKGELGEIYQLEANLSGPGGGARQGWRNDPAECPVGSMTGLGVHMVDNLHYLAGPVKRLSAFSNKLSSKGSQDNVASIVLEFESGALGYIGTTYGIPKVFNTAAFGTNANAWSEEEGKRLFIQSKGEQTRTEESVDDGDAIADELADFARCIREGESPEAGGPEGLEVIAVLEAVIESVKSNRVVEVSQIRGQ